MGNMKTPSLLVDLSHLCSQARDFLDDHKLDQEPVVKEDPAQLARLELFRRIKEQLDQLMQEPNPSEP